MFPMISSWILGVAIVVVFALFTLDNTSINSESLELNITTNNDIASRHIPINTELPDFHNGVV